MPQILVTPEYVRQLAATRLLRFEWLDSRGLPAGVYNVFWQDHLYQIDNGVITCLK